MTNREWLESLSDEELAKFLIKRKVCTICAYHKLYRSVCNSKTILRLNCSKGVIEWLQTEHKDKED